jgi:tetratricopeptide (TPR) repeat protein
VRYALACQEGAPWQVRFTDTDNAPQGREVHWSSGFVHLVSLAGRIQHMVTGEPLPRATEKALAWFNLPLLLGCIVLFSAWTAARAGAAAGVLVALGMIGHRAFYDGFMPNNVDHHGLLTASGFGVVLGVMFMGAGWWRASSGGVQLVPVSREAVRRAAIVSGVSGAIGMWISAASTIPVIAIVGIAGLASALWFGRRARQDGAEFDAGAWRIWGRVGAGTTLIFYLLEYAPSHFSLRLEANHPFHALAWWGGSELIALVAAWRLDRKAGRIRVMKLIPPLLALSVAPLTVYFAGDRAFVVSDPFVADERHMVDEGASFRAAVQRYGWDYEQRYVINFVLVGVGLVLMMITRRDHAAFAFVTMVALAFVALSCWEIRWWLTASGPLLCLCIAIVVVVALKSTLRTRWVLAIGLGAVLLPSGAYSGARMFQRLVRTHTADLLDLLEPLYRDVASVLRASQPKGDIVLLASPNASTGISYYGRFKTIGTLYWENTAGLKVAAAIYCAESDDSARELLHARGVTHLALISNWGFLNEFFRLLRPNAPPGDVERTFVSRLLKQEHLPRWLKIIPYRPPANMTISGLTVMLLQVVPEQSELDAAWNLAMAQLTLGVAERAEKNFRQAIALAAPAQQASLFQAAADYAGTQQAIGTAIRFYRSGLALAPSPRSAAELAWLLSTTSDPALRSGREALALVEPVVQANANDLVLLNAFAGALAENGRFTDAVQVANRAVALARAAGDNRVAAIMQQRMDVYRSGKPWRQ